LRVASSHVDFGYGGLNSVTTIFFTWLEATTPN